VQLIKNDLRRLLAGYAYASGLLGAALLVNLSLLGYDAAHPDRVLDVLYLFVAAVLLSMPVVRLQQGTLSLYGIIGGAAVVLANPLDATIIGLATAIGLAASTSIALRRRGVWPLLGNAAICAGSNALAALLAAQLRVGSYLPFAPRLAVILTMIVAQIAMVSTAFSIRTGQSIPNVLRQTLLQLLASYAYFALAALVISYVLDGTPLGYVLATIVCVLALALTDTIAGRRVRTGLESELSDADRHLVHSRAVEGVVHNLRNHMATAQAYLREIDTRKLDDVDRESLETATEAANDAVAVLHSLAQGATPKVSFSPNPVDLNELAARAIGMARPRARTKEVQLGIRESAADVKVRADPLLLREVMTNLVNNAIDAAPDGGRVDLSTGRRANGSPFVSVADNGPGVTDDHRHHLFEPHFTTKEGGTGLGLFMSYGIVREHQGQLIYEGNRRGAVFTVALPAFVNEPPQ